MSAAAKTQLLPGRGAGVAATDAIVAETVRACAKRYGSRLSAIALTGSLARNEGSFLAGPNGRRLLGDAELFLVFRSFSLTPSSRDLRELSESISASLADRRLFCRVDLAGVDHRYLRTMPRHILTYELRMCGRVVFGDPETLRSVPEFSAAAIRREDAWRLLSNRMVEWLEALANEPAGGDGSSLALFYATVKLWMDIATSLLVFLERYEPGYRLRARRLATLAADRGPAPRLPFPLGDLAEGVGVATQWKLSPEPAIATRLGWEFCDRARRLAAQLWGWELAEMTGAAPEFPLPVPPRKLEQGSGRANRCRAWLRAMRECGWTGSLRHCRRWPRLARSGSPRHWIYGLAAECMRRENFPPAGADDAISPVWLGELRRFLPLGAAGKGPSVTWRCFVLELARNYHLLVEKTCT